MNRFPAFRNRQLKTAFTLVELLVTIAIIGILLGMLLPATRSVGEAARRTQCLNNARQLMLATLNYETAHMRFPAAIGDESLSSYTDDYQRLSGLVAILPFIEQNSLHEQITQVSEFDGTSFPALPSPTNRKYPPWQTHIPAFHCPSSYSDNSIFGKTNYAFCVGDMAREIHRPKENLRGVFGFGRSMTFGEITDGSSNTFSLIEIGNRYERNIGGDFAINQPTSLLDDPSLCLSLSDESNKYLESISLSNVGRGGCWADGSAGPGIVNTILPPNSPSCAVDGSEASDGFYSASSTHPGSVTAAMCDGSVHSVDIAIDCGDLSNPTLTTKQLSDDHAQSPHGAWGSLGAANDGRSVSVLDF